MAVQHADLICSWQEALPRDEMPPRWMWPFPDELAVWFERVEREREKKYKTGGRSEPDGFSVEDGDNEYATEALKKLGVVA